MLASNIGTMPPTNTDNLPIKRALRFAENQSRALDILQERGFRLENYGASVMVLSSHNGANRWLARPQHISGWMLEKTS